MKDFLLFKWMVSPILVQIFFWLAIIFSIVYGIFAMFHAGFFHGLFILVAGVLMSRIYAEIILIFFKIHDDVKAIREKK